MVETISKVISSIREKPSVPSDGFIKLTSINPNKHMIDNESKKENEACAKGKKAEFLIGQIALIAK